MSALMRLWPSSFLGRAYTTNDTLAGSRLTEAFNDSRDDYDWLSNIASSLDCSDDLPILVDLFPSLFSVTLPPCGLNAQIAYQNIVHRLRRLHLHHSTTKTVLSLCNTVRDLLDAEEQINRMGTLALTGTRSPWRREMVLDYEMRWARYFVREAEVLDRWAQTNEVQREKQDLMNRLYPVPKELKIIFRNRANVKDVHQLWMAWHEEKRADMKIDDGKEVEMKAEED